MASLLAAGLISIWFPLVAIVVALIGMVVTIKSATSGFGRVVAVLVTPLVLLGFGVRYMAAQEAEKHQTEVTAASTPPQTMSPAEVKSNPEGQLSWIAKVQGHCAAYKAAANQIKKSDIFRDNNKLLDDVSVNRVIGRLDGLVTNQGGDELTLTIRVGRAKFTTNSLFSAIKRGSPVYSSATNMTEGQCVLFSARKIEPLSVFEESKVCDLDYNADFTEVGPCPAPYQGEQAAAPRVVEKEAKAEPASEPLGTVTAAKLWKDFDENEAAANDRYVGNEFIVTGRVNKVTDTFPGTTVYISGPDGEARAGAGDFPDSDRERLSKLRPGQAIAVKCEVRGSTMADLIMLQPCSFASPAELSANNQSQPVVPATHTRGKPTHSSRGPMDMTYEDNGTCIDATGMSGAICSCAVTMGKTPRCCLAVGACQERYGSNPYKQDELDNCVERAEKKACR